jgi:hypothetical protein
MMTGQAHAGRRLNRRSNTYSCCGARKVKEAEEDLEDGDQAVLAPINERAVYATLKTRDLLEDIEAVWVGDDAWLDRIICGKLVRKGADEYDELLSVS